MPKNKGKGGKNRRRGKNENDLMKRELIFKEDGQEYAQVSAVVDTGWVGYSGFAAGYPTENVKNRIDYLERIKEKNAKKKIY